jgi:hypothetical protein
MQNIYSFYNNNILKLIIYYNNSLALCKSIKIIILILKTDFLLQQDKNNIDPIQIMINNYQD